MGLEERGLRGVKSGRALGHDALDGGDDAGLGSRRLDILVNHGLQLAKVTVGEHEAEVALHHGHDSLPLGVAAVRGEVSDATTDHGVLTEHQLGLAAQGNPNVGDLLRSDEVSIYDERTLVLVEALGQVSEIRDFLVLSNHDDELSTGAPTLR